MPEWRTRTPVGEYQPLEIVRFPFYAENLLVITFFSLMFLIACFWASLPHGMGIRSVGFWFICITLFFNYAFVIVDYTARGVKNIPKLSGEMVFPTHDMRLYTVAFLTVGTLAFVFGAWESDKQSLRLVSAFILYPLLFSMLVVSHSLAVLVNPLILMRRLLVFISCSHALFFFVIQLFAGVLLYWNIASFGVISAWHLFWQVPVTLIMLFLLFRSLGVVLNRQGPKMGLSVLTNQDIHQQARNEDDRLMLDEFVLELYRWVRVHEYNKAWDHLLEFQRKNRHKFDDALYIRLGQWEDQRLASRLGGQMAESRLKQGDVTGALRLFRQSFEVAPSRFTFSSAGVALSFLEACSDVASKQAMLTYMQGFVGSYPNYPKLRYALLKAVELALEQQAFAVARLLLDQASDSLPGVHEDAEFIRLTLALNER